MDRKRKPLSQLSLDDYNIQKRSKSDIHPKRNIRAGTISKIVLKNFMCHSYLEVDFENNINFIIGRNGSGKSAILTALVVGLGAKASVTNRGKSIKGFVKAGKNSASVEITINNSGPMAYNPNLFGSEIVILRNIHSSGSSVYKIKNAAGKIVSSQTKEIHRITTNLNIQVDNPVCILNQDTSRNFLSTSDTKQKFTLFMRATRLEDLAEEYQKMSQNKRSCISLLKEKGNLLKDLEAEIKELKVKYESLQSIVRLRDQLSQLQLELLWGKARDAEGEFDQKEKTYQMALAKCDEIEDNIKNKNKKLEDITNKVGELQQQIIELSNEAEIQAKPQNEIKIKISELKDTLAEKRREKQIVQRAIDNQSGECESLEIEISNFTKNLSRLEQEKVNRLNSMKDIEEKIKGIECLVETTQNDQFQIKNDIKRKVEDEKSLRRELRQTNEEYSQAETHLNSLKSESNNNLLLYGRDMSKIVNAINENKESFNQVPKGPLGSYIKIKDKKWAVAIEGFLSPRLLQSFAVDNKHDSALLMKIFDKFWSSGPKPTIITSKFFNKVHDVSRNLVRPVDGCLSVFDALTITDPVVANCLIDQTAMESVLLIPTGQKARDLLSEASSVPRHCSQGITIKGDKYYPDPNYKTYASTYHQARYLQVNTTDIIKDLEQKLFRLQDKRESIQNQHNTIEQEIQAQSRMLTELTRKFEKLNKARQALRHQHDEMKSSADPEIGNVQNLESELNELRKSLNEKHGVINKIEDAINKIRENIGASEDNLKKLMKSSKSFQSRMVPLEQQINELANKKTELSVNENFEKKRLLDLKRRLENTRLEMEEQRRNMENLISQASTVGERMEEIRSVKSIGMEINELERSIKKIEANTEKPEEISRQYQDKIEKHGKSFEIIASLEDNAKELINATEKRKKHYRLTEEYFITYIQHAFESILEFRQFRGNLEIDMNNRTLDMVVIPQQGSQGLTTTANLSGGERSFSTVAFLYSLWQCMEFPFYFLDEFDVYMDKVNRTKVMEILIHHAKSRPELQFVFLTPQDVSFIHDNAVAVHRLEDPKRKEV